jgi:hypothetical protein
MKFLRFQNGDGNYVFIRPDQVVAIEGGSQDSDDSEEMFSLYLTGQDTPFLLMGNANEVVFRLLRGK